MPSFLSHIFFVSHFSIFWSVFVGLEEYIKLPHSKMNYKAGTEIVLILSFASDKMISMMNMFLEVFFMDVTFSTNCQNRPLFLIVLKDANGEAHIGNISVLPSEKNWVFNEIFRTVFMLIWGVNNLLQWSYLDWLRQCRSRAYNEFYWNDWCI